MILFRLKKFFENYYGTYNLETGNNYFHWDITRTPRNLKGNVIFWPLNQKQINQKSTRNLTYQN